MATTEDWARIETAAQAWGHSRQGDLCHQARCILDLRRRMEALEQRALTAPEPSAAEPAPAADRPLWREVRGAMQAVPGEIDWVAAQLAVADWLAARGCEVSADLLRAEARRARQQ